MIGLFIYIYVVLFGLCCVGIKKSGGGSEANTLSRDCTTSIRGVGMLLIIMAHAIGSYITPLTYFYYVSAVLGVSACFLVSGYGLAKSRKYKQNYMKWFLIPKFARCLIPYFVIYAIYLLVMLLQNTIPSLDKIGYEIATLQLDGLLLWYLKIQLLMYVFFFIVYRWTKINDKIALIFISILTVLYMIIAWKSGLEAYWYNTCWFFPLGILLEMHEEKIVTFCKKSKTVLGSLILTVIMFAFIYMFGRMGAELLVDGIYMLSFNCFLIGFFSLFENAMFCKLLGKYSMEIYLLHLLLLKLTQNNLFNPQNGVSYLLLIGATILISLPIYKISSFLTDRTKMICGQKMHNG